MSPYAYNSFHFIMLSKLLQSLHHFIFILSICAYIFWTRCRGFIESFLRQFWGFWSISYDLWIMMSLDGQRCNGKRTLLTWNKENSTHHETGAFWKVLKRNLLKLFEDMRGDARLLHKTWFLYISMHVRVFMK